jgi:hypothetical protein
MNRIRPRVCRANFILNTCPTATTTSSSEQVHTRPSSKAPFQNDCVRAQPDKGDIERDRNRASYIPRTWRIPEDRDVLDVLCLLDQSVQLVWPAPRVF